MSHLLLLSKRGYLICCYSRYTFYYIDNLFITHALTLIMVYVLTLFRLLFYIFTVLGAWTVLPCLSSQCRHFQAGIYLILVIQIFYTSSYCQQLECPYCTLTFFASGDWNFRFLDYFRLVARCIVRAMQHVQGVVFYELSSYNRSKLVAVESWHSRCLALCYSFS